MRNLMSNGCIYYILLRFYVWSGVCKVYVVQEKSAEQSILLEIRKCGYFFFLENNK